MIKERGAKVDDFYQGEKKIILNPFMIDIVTYFPWDDYVNFVKINGHYRLVIFLKDKISHFLKYFF